jgi:hypothetical protein
MRVRLTDIALSTGAGVFPIGAVLVVGEDIDAGLAQLRLEAKTAELVAEDDDVLSPSVAEAMELHQADFSQMQASLVALATAVEEAGSRLVDARAFMELMRARSPDTLVRIHERCRAIEQLVEDANDAWRAALFPFFSSTEGPQAQVVDEAASTAASEDAAADGSTASEVLSAVEPTVDETSAAPPAEVEPPAADASTDTPPATEQVATAEPAAVAQVAEAVPAKAAAKAKAKAASNSAGGS